MKKQLLVDDERGRGVPVVVGYGPYLFVSGSDGHRDLETERINPELAGNATAQCRNSYGRIQRRLEKAGFPNTAVWIQNFTSGQEWRLQRMALWPEFFGQTEHGLAVSFGAQARMSGLNMITTIVLATTEPRQAIVPQPEPGRAARVVRAGPFIYVIGVRGTHGGAPEETADAFVEQLNSCWHQLEAHLTRAGAKLDDFVYINACIRNVNCLPDYRQRSPKLRAADYVVGMPMGARGEHEIGGIALAPGERSPLRFIAACRGADDGPCGDRAGQTRHALRQLEERAEGLHNVLRLDVFLRDIYFEDECLAILKDAFGQDMPAVTFVGADLAGSGEIELAGIAGAA